VTRGELIEVGKRAFAAAPPGRDLIAAVVDAVEPLIRADERSYTRTAAGVRVEAEAKMADLRAKVEALPGNDPFQSPVRRDAYEYAIADVLALFDDDGGEL